MGGKTLDQKSALDLFSGKRTGRGGNRQPQIDGPYKGKKKSTKEGKTKERSAELSGKTNLEEKFTGLNMNVRPWSYNGEKIC